MKVNKNIIRKEIEGEDGGKLVVCYDRTNIAAGVSLQLHDGWRTSDVESLVTLEPMELNELTCALREPVRKVSASFASPEGDEFVVRYENRGEPYREGVQFLLRDQDYVREVGVFVESREIGPLCKLLNALCSQYGAEEDGVNQ